MRNDLLALFSPGRLCGTDRRLPSGSSLPLLAGAVRAPFLLLAVVLALGGLTGWSQCPAAGADTTCGTIITITDAGTTISATGQGPYYNGGEGGTFATASLVGVINNSSQSVLSLNLSSPYPIFYFIAGQGIDSFGVAGNSTDSSGYGGPNAYFSGIDPLLMQGTVNFITPIAANGGTSFFSLANDLTQVAANSCAAAINNAVTMPISGGTDVDSIFTPVGGLSLSQAAAACGFNSWNWQQLITNLPAPSPFNDRYYTTNYTAPLPFNDPPADGYSYQYNTGYNAVGLPIYYNITGTPADLAIFKYQTTPYTLTFHDAPADKCLAGGDPTVCSPLYPGGSTLDAPGEVLGFSTHLVGLIGTDLTATVVDTGVGFTYTDNFNGTSGGTESLNNPGHVDPGSGTGGVTVTGTTPVTSRRFPQSLIVKTVNGAVAAMLPPLRLLPRTQVTATASGLAYSRATKTFTGTVTLKNISKAAIAGPFQVVLLGLSKGARLSNANGGFGGAPFLSVQGASTLAAGASLTVPVRFSNPSLGAIAFSPATYTGGFN